jgi:hypothetical protein
MKQTDVNNLRTRVRPQSTSLGALCLFERELVRQTGVWVRRKAQHQTISQARRKYHIYQTMGDARQSNTKKETERDTRHVGIIKRNKEKSGATRGCKTKGLWPRRNRVMAEKGSWPFHQSKTRRGVKSLENRPQITARDAAQGRTSGKGDRDSESA